MKRAVLLAVSLTAPLPAPADLGINVYGQRDQSKAGRYRVARSERWQWIFDAGTYRESGRHTALLAGAGALP